MDGLEGSAFKHAGCAVMRYSQEQMQEELKDADSDENIEDQAREKLKLTKPGETIYIPETEEE